MTNENKNILIQSKTNDQQYLYEDQMPNRSIQSVPLALFSILFLGVGLGQLWRPIRILLLMEEGNDVYGYIGYNLLELIIPGFFIITLSLFIIGLLNIVLFILIWNKNNQRWVLGLFLWVFLTIEDLWSIFWIQREIENIFPNVANFLIINFGIDHSEIRHFLTTQV